MTCNETRNETLNQAAAHMLHSNEMMAQLAEAIERVNEWADCTDGVPVDLWYISNQPELAAQNHGIIEVLELIRHAMNEDADFIVPVEFPPDAFGIENPMDLKPGDTLTAREDIRVRLQSLPLGEGCGDALAAFTSYEELEAGPATSSIRMGIADLMHRALMSEDFQGLMLNPWGSRHFFLTKVLIQMILRADVVIALQQAGEGALSLARQRSRDSGQNWCTRAFYAMEGLSLADAAEKRQILEEVLADLERLASDYVREGEAARTMSGVPKSMQAWFYSQMQDGLAELQEDPECAGAYWTMVALYKELFVSYWLLGNPGTIYQISASGEGYVLHKNDMMWEPYTGEIPGDAVAVSRREAEGKEDEWRGEFWMIQAGNLDDGYYHLYSTTERGVELWIRNGELRFDGEDYKPIEREFHYSMNRENSWKFLSALRLKYGLETSLEEILKMEFGYDDGPWRFRKFCREVEAEFHTINL